MSCFTEHQTTCKKPLKMYICTYVRTYVCVCVYLHYTLILHTYVYAHTYVCMSAGLSVAYQVVTREELLKELCLLLLDCLNDKLVVTRNVEERPTGSRVGQFSE